MVHNQWTKAFATLCYVWHQDHEYKRRQHFIKPQATFLRELDSHFKRFSWSHSLPDNTHTLKGGWEREKHGVFVEYGVNIVMHMRNAHEPPIHHLLSPITQEPDRRPMVFLCVVLLLTQNYALPEGISDTLGRATFRWSAGIYSTTATTHIDLRFSVDRMQRCCSLQSTGMQ